MGYFGGDAESIKFFLEPHSRENFPYYLSFIVHHEYDSSNI